MTTYKLRENEEAEEEDECDDRCPGGLDVGGVVLKDTEWSIVGVANVFPFSVVANDVVLYSDMDQISVGEKIMRGKVNIPQSYK
jgi:hypothetical protein